MANPPSSLISESKYQQFIEKINYHQLIKSPPEERNLHIDWKAELHQLKSLNNRLWQVTNYSEQLADQVKSAHEISANLSMDNQIIIVDIEILNGNWQARLDKVIHKLTFTNTAEVYGDLVKSKADFHHRRHHSAHMLIGHYYIRLSAWNEVSDDEFDYIEKTVISIVTDH